MMDKRKFEITQVANGYILGLINPNFAPGDRENKYYSTAYVATSPQDVADQLVAFLVQERMAGAA